MSSTVQHEVRGEVVGWGTVGAAWAEPEARGAARLILDALGAAGVQSAFGVLGGGIAPFAAGLGHSPIRFFHFRHEAGAGFAAIESYFETGRPGVVVVTTGPGLFNVLNAAMAARVDGAKLVVISGFTSRHQAGRGAVQETTLHSMPAELTRPGSLFHDVAIPETEAELVNALARIQRGLAAPGGFVAHLGLPLALQTQAFPRIATSENHNDVGTMKAHGPRWSFAPAAPAPAAVQACLDALADPTAVLWVGHGALRAHAELLRFAEAAHLPVVSSPRAKGVFPEQHPLFIGVSGAGGSPAVRQWFVAHRPEQVLVVGSRLGEVTSFLAQDLVPAEGWIHVDIDPTAFGAAFPEPRGLGIVADATQFFEALHARAEATGWYARRVAGPQPAPRPADVWAPQVGDVRPPYLMQCIQAQVVAGSDALIMSEAGTSFTWCNAHLQFATPGRYRTSAAWGSMGHFTTGCVGAALAARRRVVAVVGDGAMLMNNEINTAVQYGADVVWIVLNDAQLGLNEHGMTALGMRPVETQMPRTDFVAFARAQGADGLAVDSELAVVAALEVALKRRGPFLLDVRVDRSIASPVVADRIRSLKRQAGGAA